MKKTISVLAATVCLAASAGAFSKPPVPMTDAQMDKVTAGALANVIAVKLTTGNNNVAVAIPINAASAINVLGGAISGVFQGQPGRFVFVEK